MKRFAFVVRIVLFFFAFQQIGWALEVQPNGVGFRATWGESRTSDEVRVAKRQIQIIEAEPYDRSKEYSTSMAYRPERPLLSKEQFLVDFKAGKLLATPEQFCEALAHAGVSVTDVFEYLQGLEWRKNSIQKPARMARLLQDYGSKRSRLDYGLVRNLEAGEYALWDGDRPIVAGDCGNVIDQIIGEKKETKRQAVVLSEPPPPPSSVVVPAAPPQASKQPSWWSKNWPWVVGVVVIGGIVTALAGGGQGGGGSNPSSGPSPPPPGNN